MKLTHHTLPILSGTVLVAAMLLLCASFATPAGAQALPRGDGPVGGPHPPHFAGQVTALIGSASNPTGFTLQVRDRSIDFKIVSKTSFTSRSAEALVEGFSPNDFAAVSAGRLNGDWVAYRIVYDVVPFGPIRFFTISGTIVKLDASDHHFLLKMAGGNTHWIAITSNTQYQVAGQPTNAVVELSRDTTVEVHVRRMPGGRWVALTINVKQAVGSS